jgi:allophanate hydrolase subunit 1
VALAGEFSAIYPRSSPGGWQLIGHTEAIVFDVDREPPALLQLGVAVRFVETSGVSDDG